MFKDKTTCLKMVKGSYRKLKSYYYYNKNYIIIREKIAKFEADREAFNHTFDKLSLLLIDPNCETSTIYFQDLLKDMDFCVLPKKFASKPEEVDCVTSNAIPKDKKLKDVNFFTDFPIEIFILDTLWTLLLGKITYDNKLLSKNVYGNTLATHVLYNNNNDDIVNSINFESLRMFNIYFYKYSDWRNNAFSALDINYSKGRNSVLVSLDIKSYYYNVKFNFDLHELLGEHSLILSMNKLSELMKEVFKRYFQIIRPYRKDFTNFRETEYPLPIGLFSSMLIANLYLTKFDLKVKILPACNYYGRYVDDMLFCFSIEETRKVNLTNLLQKTLVDSNVLGKIDYHYVLSDFPSLKIEKEKIKVIYINACESRAIIDIFNEKFRILPSQMNILPDYDLKLEDFNESAYSIENFDEQFKIRNIGNINIDAFKVSRYFSTLVLKQCNIEAFSMESENDISKQMRNIEKFFVGSQGLEYYSNWMNYAYFLVLTRKYNVLKKFYTRMKETIKEIKGNSLNHEIFNKYTLLCERTRKSLNRHLHICVATALAIDIVTIKKPFLKSFSNLANLLMESNMFNHTFVSLYHYLFQIFLNMKGIYRIVVWM